MVSRLRETPTITKIALVIWILSAVFVTVLLNRIDGIVHGDLYRYGLQFSYDWAINYWVLLRLAYVCLATPSVLTVTALAYNFLRRKNSAPQVVLRSRANTPSLSKTHKENNGARVRDNNVIISCPKCRKVFDTPLSMIDFGTGKAKLVSVCPHCSHILWKGEEKLGDIRILEPRKKEVDR